MVENKHQYTTTDGRGRYQPFSSSSTSTSSYEPPTVVESAVSDDEEEEEQVVVVQVVTASPTGGEAAGGAAIASAPTEEDLLVQMVEENHNEVVVRTTNSDADQEQRDITRERELRAQQEAAQAREQGVALIRNHLDEYLVQNPDANYVTWIATLHPENAEVTIDPRFLIPGNPWATVFEEARSAAMTGVNNESFSMMDDFDLNNDEEESKNEYEPTSHHHHQNHHHHRSASYPYLGGLIPMMIGFSLLLAAVLITLALQLVSTIVYTLAMLFKCICTNLLPSFSIWSAILYVIPGSLWLIFQGLDVLLLVLDTVLVEVLALLAYVICMPLAFSHTVGKFYHQQIRRLPHFVRWACRKPLQKWRCNDINNNNNSTTRHHNGGDIILSISDRSRGSGGGRGSGNSFLTRISTSARRRLSSVTTYTWGRNRSGVMVEQVTTTAVNGNDNSLLLHQQQHRQPGQFHTTTTTSTTTTTTAMSPSQFLTANDDDDSSAGGIP